MSLSVALNSPPTTIVMLPVLPVPLLLAPNEPWLLRNTESETKTDNLPPAPSSKALVVTPAPLLMSNCPVSIVQFPASPLP